MNSSYTVSCDSSCAYSAIVALAPAQNKALILTPLNLALSLVLKWGKKKKCQVTFQKPVSKLAHLSNIQVIASRPVEPFRMLPGRNV